MKFQIHDPGHVALRRGIRAAIGVPITCALILVILPKSAAGLVAAFGSLCLIAICDFGGPLRRRLMSLLGAGAVGAVLISIGILASQVTAAAVIVTFVVGVVLAFSPILRGAVTSGATAMTIMYVVAVTAGMPASDLPKAIIAWLVALVIAIPLTLFVLPRRDLAPVRQACAAALLAFADAFAARGRGEEPDKEALKAAHEGLKKSYLGNPFRAAGLNHKDRALVALAGHIQALLSSLIHGRIYPSAMHDDPGTHRLNELSAAGLAEAGRALGPDGAAPPSGLPIVDAWHAQWAEAATMLEGAAGDAEERVREVAAMFPDRMASVAAVRTVMLTRRVLDVPDEQYPSGPHEPEIPAPAVSRGSEDLRAEATFNSPWTRLALRTGLGLALAVLVVAWLGLAHGLWVVLGVTSVLRVDGLTTARTAVFAIIGTFGGAAIGFALLAADTTDAGWLWLALIAATFLAVWVPAAVGFAYGQAAFSVFVIVAFTVMTWPPDLETATDRLEDVAIGAAVSIVVALLLWPGGVMKGTIANVSEAVRSSMALLRDSVTSLVVGGAVPDSRVSASAMAMARSQEVVELTLSSPNKGAAAMAHEWEGVIDHLRNPAVVARLLATWAPFHGPIVEVAPQLEEPLMRELARVLEEWDAVAEEVDGAPVRVSVGDATTLDELAAVAATADLANPLVADRVLAGVWGYGWLQMSLRAGTAVAVPTRA